MCSAMIVTSRVLAHANARASGMAQTPFGATVSRSVLLSCADKGMSLTLSSETKKVDLSLPHYKLNCLENLPEQFIERDMNRGTMF